MRSGMPEDITRASAREVYSTNESMGRTLAAARPVDIVSTPSVRARGDSAECMRQEATQRQALQINPAGRESARTHTPEPIGMREHNTVRVEGVQAQTEPGGRYV